jgi:hypothetical protein
VVVRAFPPRGGFRDYGFGPERGPTPSVHPVNVSPDPEPEEPGETVTGVIAISGKNYPNYRANTSGLNSSVDITYPTLSGFAVSDPTVPGSGTQKDMVFGDGRFFATDRAFPSKLYVSTDGANWSERANPAGASVVHGIAYGTFAGSNRFLLIGSGGNVFVSSDLLDWTLTKDLDTAETGSAVVKFLNDIWFYIYTDSNTGDCFCYTSDGSLDEFDEMDWVGPAEVFSLVAQKESSSKHINGLAYNGSRYVAVGSATQDFLNRRNLISDSSLLGSTWSGGAFFTDYSPAQTGSANHITTDSANNFLCIASKFTDGAPPPEPTDPGAFHISLSIANQAYILGSSLGDDWVVSHEFPAINTYLSFGIASAPPNGPPSLSEWCDWTILTNIINTPEGLIVVAGMYNRYMATDTGGQLVLDLGGDPDLAAKQGKIWVSLDGITFVEMAPHDYAGAWNFNPSGPSFINNESALIHCICAGIV